MDNRESSRGKNVNESLVCDGIGCLKCSSFKRWLTIWQLHVVFFIAFFNHLHFCFSHFCLLFSFFFLPGIISYCLLTSKLVEANEYISGLFFCFFKSWFLIFFFFITFLLVFFSLPFYFIFPSFLPIFFPSYFLCSFSFFFLLKIFPSLM